MSRGKPITAKGKIEIEKTLEHLIKVEREQLKKSIAEARALGDLKENAEYHSAKEKQALVEGKIMQLQGVLATAEIVDISKVHNSTIVFGATVTLFDVDKNQSITYQIVGNEEADINRGLVSVESPLGKALIGKEEGDTVIVRAPKGDIEYEIEELQYI